MKRLNVNASPNWRRRLARSRSIWICPAALAYGDRGSPPRIKPGSTLTFEVELLEIVK